MSFLRNEELTEKIIGAGIEVHRELGPGLLESAYEECLCHELHLRNLSFRRQVPLPVNYKNTRLDCGYRVDIIVEEQVILEIKCVETVLDVHKAQLITYLKLSNIPVGLLLNFHVPTLKQGILRLVV